jgi:hypothetical protein
MAIIKFSSVFLFIIDVKAHLNLLVFYVYKLSETNAGYIFVDLSSYYLF